MKEFMWTKINLKIEYYKTGLVKKWNLIIWLDWSSEGKNWRNIVRGRGPTGEIEGKNDSQTPAVLIITKIFEKS